jgi:GMP synthase-like glutamine amidotransferase
MSNEATSVQQNDGKKPAKTADLTLGYLGMGTGQHRPFDQVYPKAKLVTADDIETGCTIDALVIWGGADISPSLYSERVSSLCGATYELSKRDYEEASACQAAIERGIPIIGVCRGAQLACAVSGGRLLQHVDNHGRTHLMDTHDGLRMKTSSVHHQMMYPFDVEHKLLAWASEKLSQRYIIGDDTSDPEMADKPEPEIVWFPKTKSLAIQGHPEFHSDPKNDPFVQYCMELVRKFIVDEQDSTSLRSTGEE